MPGSSEPFAAGTGLHRLDDVEATRELARYRRRRLPADQMPLRVGHLVPTGYPAYCRVFPALMVRPAAGGMAQRRRWALVLPAGRLAPGELVAGLAAAREVLIRQGAGVEAAYGYLDPATTAALVTRLTAALRSDPECVYYFWSGRAVVGQRPGHSVYVGPLSSAAQLVPVGHPGLETPSAMWPWNMSWCLAMHTDAAVAYLGGDAALTAAILADPAMEATSVRAEDPADVWTPSG